MAEPSVNERWHLETHCHVPSIGESAVVADSDGPDSVFTFVVDVPMLIAHSLAGQYADIRLRELQVFRTKIAVTW